MPAGRSRPCCASCAPGARASGRHHSAVTPSSLPGSSRAPPAATRDSGRDARCELRVGDDSFILTGTDDGVDVRAGTVGDARGGRRPSSRASSCASRAARSTPADAAGQIEVEGDGRLADEVVAMLAGSAR